MADLTRQDKLSILMRLTKRIKDWRFQKGIPMIVFLGQPSLSRSSHEFQQWLKDANEGITVVFGEHSHWLAEFNDIEYYEKFSALLGDNKANESNFWKGLGQAQSLLESMIKEIEADRAEATVLGSIAQTNVKKGAQCVFIGHGRSPLWLDVRRVLREEWGLDIVCFESEPRTSNSIVPILIGMLDRATFAVIVLTAEDITASGEARGRQNVIHEAGLTQGKLGFEKVAILKQEGVEEPSNLAGSQYISFPGSRIEKGYYELQAALKREGLIS